MPASPKRTHDVLETFLLRFVLFATLFFGSLTAAALDGFTQTGETWTYAVAGKPTINGILIKPAGSGPFPAVIISHGKGGSVQGFTLNAARTMAAWGLVCIGANYTHAPNDPLFSDASQEGARPENLRRAQVCFEILQNLAYVDATRVAAFGHSMGAFVTLGFCGQSPEIKVAAITAGGIVPSGDFAAPTVAEAITIRAPFLMLHGTTDTTVPPERSLLLKQTLDAQNVVNERVLYTGVGHDLPQSQSADVYARVRTWFDTHGLFATSAAAAGAWLSLR